MALAERSAEVIWHGTLASGDGVLKPGGGAFSQLPIDWASRSEEADGTSSPEELLAAALASCYAMALSLTLTHNGTPPQELGIRAACSLDEVAGEYKVTRMRLRVNGRVEGIDQQTFESKAREADFGCPISNVMRNNVEIELDASLDG